jgi:hypothetical protein
MQKRLVLGGLAAIVLLLGFGAAAEAAVVNPTLGPAAPASATIKTVHWVCGPSRCAWIPDYGGPIVVHPYMRGWGPPPGPHCNYVRGRRGHWVLVCP